MSLLAHIHEHYPAVESGHPVLIGHVLKKFADKDLSHIRIAEWATMENVRNGFPTITGSMISKLKVFFKKRHDLHRTVFRNECKIEAHLCILSPHTTTTTSSSSATSAVDKSKPASSASASISPADKILLKELVQVKKELLYIKREFHSTKHKWHVKISRLKKKLANAETKLQVYDKEVHLLREKLKEAEKKN